MQAFADKAQELSNKGHLLRAAENFGRAAAVARALGADNLLLVHMQRHQGSAVGSFTFNADTTAVEPRVLAAHRANFIALTSAAVAALERRRVAGTLLLGHCAAAEVA